MESSDNRIDDHKDDIETGREDKEAVITSVSTSDIVVPEKDTSVLAESSQSQMVDNFNWKDMVDTEKMTEKINEMVENAEELKTNLENKISEVLTSESKATESEKDNVLEPAVESLPPSEPIEEATPVLEAAVETLPPSEPSAESVPEFFQEQLAHDLKDKVDNVMINIADKINENVEAIKEKVEEFTKPVEESKTDEVQLEPMTEVEEPAPVVTEVVEEPTPIVTEVVDTPRIAPEFLGTVLQKAHDFKDKVEEVLEDIAQPKEEATPVLEPAVETLPPSEPVLVEEVPACSYTVEKQVEEIETFTDGEILAESVPEFFQEQKAFDQAQKEAQSVSDELHKEFFSAPVIEEKSAPEPVVEDKPAPEPVIEEKLAPEPVVEEKSVPVPESLVEIKSNVASFIAEATHDISDNINNLQKDLEAKIEESMKEESKTEAAVEKKEPEQIEPQPSQKVIDDIKSEPSTSASPDDADSKKEKEKKKKSLCSIL